MSDPIVSAEATKKIEDIGKIHEFTANNGLSIFYTNLETGEMMQADELIRTVRPLKNSIVDSLLRIGDVVMMNAKDRNERSCSIVPNGAMGVVSGYSHFVEYVDYHNTLYYKLRSEDGSGVPGVFLCKGAVLVTWMNGEDTQGFAKDIFNLTEHESGKFGQDREGYNEYQNFYDQRQFVKSLPDLPVWPDDTVRLNEPCFYKDKQYSVRTDIAKVSSVSYRDADENKNRGTNFPIYSIVAVDYVQHTNLVNHQSDKTETTEVYITEVVERGNYWAWYNDKTKLKFTSFEEEISFYKSLGVLQQIESPTGGYHWTLKEVSQGLNDKTICYAGTHSTEGWCVPANPELHEKFRQFTARLALYES